VLYTSHPTSFVVWLCFPLWNHVVLIAYASRSNLFTVLQIAYCCGCKYTSGCVDWLLLALPSRENASICNNFGSILCIIHELLYYLTWFDPVFFPVQIMCWWNSAIDDLFCFLITEHLQINENKYMLFQSQIESSGRVQSTPFHLPVSKVIYNNFMRYIKLWTYVSYIFDKDLQWENQTTSINKQSNLCNTSSIITSCDDYLGYNHCETKLAT
jgi:hypothetical protein